MKEINSWIIFDRTEYDDIKNKYSIDFNKWISARVNDSFIEALYTGNNKFANVKVLRHVLAPYVKDGKPRGWFYGKDNEPLRWTGIGNIFYLKGDNAKEAFSSLLLALSEGKIDDKFMKIVSNEKESFIGFAPTKLSLV